MSKLNRREFVKKSSAAGAVAPFLTGTATWAGSNDKVRVGCVGVRGRGRDNIRGFQALDGVEVVALCDIDDEVIAARLKDFEEQGRSKPKVYSDIRRLLDDPEIDVVSFATPNHWHALGTVWACQAGKDVYVEKPSSHNVWEGRKMMEAAQKYERIVQVGLQIRSSIAIQAAVDYLQSGQLGEVYLAKGLCYKWRDTIGHTPAEPVPPGVDYDLWLGPAQQRPFTRNRFHYNWHWHWECNGRGNKKTYGKKHNIPATWLLDAKWSSGFP